MTTPPFHMQRLLTGDGRNPCPGPAQCRGSPTSVAIKPSGSLRCLLPALHLSCRLFQTLLLAKSQVYGLEGKRIHSSIIGPQQSRPVGQQASRPCPLPAVCPGHHRELQPHLATTAPRRRDPTFILKSWCLFEKKNKNTSV